MRKIWFWLRQLERSYEEWGNLANKVKLYQNKISIISHCGSCALSKNSARYDVNLCVTMF